MLKPYSELVKLDVMPYCDMREAKDDNGKTIKVPYLNWAKAIELLHENGATDVWYKPLRAEDGSYLFRSAEVTSKQGRTTGCYFVSVEIHIDDKVFTMDMPLMNGSNVVYDDTLNQLRISNCHARAFVKGVAIRTGLGFSLWTGDKDTEPMTDDIEAHNIYKIKERVEQLITSKLKHGMSMDDICFEIKVKESQLSKIMGYFETIAELEKRLKSL